MLTDDQIIEMALHANLIDVGQQDIPEVFTFARLIEARVREEDAEIAETSCGDQYEIAVSIRERKT